MNFNDTYGTDMIRSYRIGTKMIKYKQSMIVNNNHHYLPILNPKS